MFFAMVTFTVPTNRSRGNMQGEINIWEGERKNLGERKN
jgi:hypothetical protein